MQAVWTRFFPASLEISRLLSRGEVGELKVVRADLGVPLTHVPRTVQKELGGGALLDIGVYCIQFVLMAFSGEKPETIQATGVCLDTGTEPARKHTAEYLTESSTDLLIIQTVNISHIISQILYTQSFTDLLIIQTVNISHIISQILYTQRHLQTC